MGVFVIALLESLAIVGMLVPGVAMMFAAGALIGTGALSFWPICLWAMAGAIVGDGLSYWLGCRYQARLCQFWPFRSHPEIIAHGIAFFNKYGGLSVLFGRFVGPIRAVIPLVAGMMGMKASRFVLFNILSAMLWAPVYLFPGVVFGASLELAAKVTGRLALILILLVTVLWFGAWLSRRLYLFFQPRANWLLSAIFDLHRRYPLLAQWTGTLLDPEQRDFLALLVLAGLLSVASILLLAVLPSQPMVSLNFLHNPLSDAIFLTIERLASWPVLGVVFFVCGTWLFRGGRYQALIHWLISLLFCGMVEILSRFLLPPGYLDSAILRSGAGYGFLALILAGQIYPARRWIVYSLASLFWVLVIFSQLYLSTISLPGLLITGMITVFWLGIAGVGYRRHSLSGVVLPGFRMVTFFTFLAVTGWVSFQQIEVLDRETPARVTMSEKEWWQKGWVWLPGYRYELFGQFSQPLILQWASPLTEIQSRLQALGWRPARRLGVESALYWLAPKASVSEIPILPHFNQGEAEKLVLLKKLPDRKTIILRLWDSGYQLNNGKSRPLWIGTVARLQVVSMADLIRFSEEIDRSDHEALTILLRDLRRQADWCMVKRETETREVWLIRLCED
ncbi:MAG: hypothetical protein AXA67_06300 [Methylothermaceae bacteria B42]|nr:MAG: hypothetical protein AXA67_06300 [Methylothermaceae bacteria B42]HHJ39851.1 hypothetical protein [Methylothermaceae bacterium]